MVARPQENLVAALGDADVPRRDHLAIAAMIVAVAAELVIIPA
jgi:hypothetical protein